MIDFIFSRLVARIQEEGKESDWKGIGMDQISRQVTSLLNEKKAKICSLSDALHEYQEAHRLEGRSSSAVHCGHESLKGANDWKERMSEEGSDKSQGHRSQFVRQIELQQQQQQQLVDKDVKMDQGRESELGEENTIVRTLLKVSSSSSSSTEITTTARSSVDCTTAAIANRHSKRKSNKRAKIENDEDDDYFSYGSDSDL